MLLTILLVVLIVLVLTGAFGYNGGSFAMPGGLLALLLAVLLVYLLISR